MSKCSRCQNDFVPLLKSDGLPYKLCDRCRCTAKKYRDKHEEQIKEYREANKEQRKEYDIYYRELNKDMLKEKAKEYREVNKDKIVPNLNWIESHANVVVLQEEIKFPNIKNHHVPWTSGH